MGDPPDLEGSGQTNRADLLTVATVVTCVGAAIASVVLLVVGFIQGFTLFGDSAAQWRSRLFSPVASDLVWTLGLSVLGLVIFAVRRTRWASPFAAGVAAVMCLWSVLGAAQYFHAVDHPHPNATDLRGFVPPSGAAFRAVRSDSPPPFAEEWWSSPSQVQCQDWGGSLSRWARHVALSARDPTDCYYSGQRGRFPVSLSLRQGVADLELWAP